MAIKVGDKAPDFTLTSFTPSDGPVEMSLSSYNGKKNVVLIFFPQSFTGGCNEEMSTMSDNLDGYSGMNAEFLGISVDGTFVQKAFAKANNIKFPLLSDFNKEVIKKYDVVHENFIHGMHNVSKRAVIVVGKDGIVKYVEVKDPGEKVEYDKIKEAVGKL